MVQFRVTITEKEYIKYYFIRSYTIILGILITLIGLGMLVYLIATSVFGNSKGGSLYLYVAVIYILIIIPISKYYSAKKQYKMFPTLNNTITYTATEEGLELKGEVFEEKFKWNIYKMLEHHAGWVLLLRETRQGKFFPISAFKSKEDHTKFIELAKQGGVKVKGKVG